MQGIYSFGEFLEVYSSDRTVRLVPAKNHTLDEPMEISLVSNIGASNLSVARVLLQPLGILEKIEFESEDDRNRVHRAFFRCKEGLVAAEPIADRIGSAVKEIVANIGERGVVPQSGGAAVTIPVVEALHTDASLFLVLVNRSIKAICEVTYELLGLERLNTNFDDLAKRLENTLGPEVDLVQYVKAHATGIRHIIYLRNYDEHPEYKGKHATQTVVRNFRLSASRTISRPSWQLSGTIETEPGDICDEMQEIITYVRDVAEQCFLLTLRLRLKPPFVIARVPLSEVETSWPVGYRVAIRFGLPA